MENNVLMAGSQVGGAIGSELQIQRTTHQSPHTPTTLEMDTTSLLHSQQEGASSLGRDS